MQKKKKKKEKEGFQAKLHIIIIKNEKDLFFLNFIFHKGFFDREKNW